MPREGPELCDGAACKASPGEESELRDEVKPDSNAAVQRLCLSNARSFATSAAFASAAGTPVDLIARESDLPRSGGRACALRRN